MSNIYEEYAILDAEIKALESKKDALRADILKKMIEEGESKVETSVGKFTVTKRKTWQYPAYIAEMSDELKALQAKAQSTGDATYTESESITFTQAKL